MSLKLIVFLLLLFTINTNSMADTNETMQEEYNYIDKIHKALSKKIVNYSYMLDSGVSSIMMDDEEDSIDSFFINEKYIDETDDSFIILKTQANFQSKYKNKYSANIRAHLALSRSKKRYNLFLDNLDDENIEDIVTDDTKAPELGVNYLAPDRYDIKQKYYIGLKGIHPFVRARYLTTFKTGDWKIEPVQTFEYSSDYEYRESTTIYFDVKPVNSTLFRVVLYRKSETNINGKDYSLALKYYLNISRDTALNLSQTFFGNTKYKYIPEDSSNPENSDVYSGIHNYTTSFSFRQSIWKKWFFYEVNPRVNFHKENSYKPNYTLLFSLDFYFGHYPNLKK